MAYKLVVEWLDGRMDVLRARSHAVDERGILHIHEEDGGHMQIPTVNLRIFRKEGGEAR